MHLSDKFNWTYVESAQIDVLELPYVNNELSMFILLPRDITGLQKVKGNFKLKLREKQRFHAYPWQSNPVSRISISIDITIDKAKGKTNPKLAQML